MSFKLQIHVTQTRSRFLVTEHLDNFMLQYSQSQETQESNGVDRGNKECQSGSRGRAAVSDVISQSVMSYPADSLMAGVCFSRRPVVGGRWLLDSFSYKLLSKIVNNIKLKTKTRGLRVALYNVFFSRPGASKNIVCLQNKTRGLWLQKIGCYSFSKIGSV